MSKIFRLEFASVLKSEAFRLHAFWVGLLLLNLAIILSLRSELISPRISNWVPQLVLNLYLLVVYVYGQLKIKAVERYDFMDLLWKMLLMGVLVCSVSLFSEAVLYLFSGQAFARTSFVANAVYLLSLVLMTTFLLTLLVAFKRLILYEKTKVLLVAWRVFEYSLVGSMVLGIFNIRLDSTLSGIFLLALLAMGVLLSVNLKWVGYLDLRQKWKSMLILLGLILCLLYFSFFTYVYRNDLALYLNLGDNILILALLAFCLFYSLLSCLVIFFNLPTSSVYEKKLQEIKGFQRLHRTFQNEDEEERLFIPLLENAQSAVDADMGWIELSEKGEEEPEVWIIGGDLKQEVLNRVIMGIKRTELQQVFMPEFSNPQGREYFVGSVAHPDYRSMLVVPLNIQEKHAGLLVLLKDVEGGFNTDALELVKTYADQACLSIENLQLLKEALRDERYKEEIAIARKVQRRLLPEQLAHHQDFELAVYSQSADEVGGDYYDSYQLNEEEYVLVIADVAGHGASAAFTMSQLKGVFHSLVPLGFSSKAFVVQANRALNKCLDKKTFITLTYVLINARKKQIEFLRAGHCPTLFYSMKEKGFLEFREKGMGLGILRNEDYENHLQENFVHYQAGDLMVLYTDGVLECKNQQNEEFGLERLKKVICLNATEDVISLQDFLIREIRKFAGKQEIEDDLTTMIIKFS